MVGRREKHFIDIKPREHQFWLDGVNIAADVEEFEIKYNAKDRQVEALITMRLPVEKFSADGVEILETQTPNPWESTGGPNA